MDALKLMSDSHAATISDMYDSGDMYDIPLTEFIVMARSAVESPEVFSGGTVPPDYDKAAAFTALVDHRTSHDVGVIFGDISDHSDEVEESYHSFNARMMSAATGASSYDMEFARAAKDAGDPSMMVKIYGDYLDSF